MFREVCEQCVLLHYGSHCGFLPGLSGVLMILNFFMLVICLPVENLILFCKIYSSPICSTFCFKILDFGVVGFFPHFVSSVISTAVHLWNIYSLLLELFSTGGSHICPYQTILFSSVKTVHENRGLLCYLQYKVLTLSDCLS